MGTEQCAVVVSSKLKLWSKSMSMKFFTEQYLWIEGTQESAGKPTSSLYFWHPVIGLSSEGGSRGVMVMVVISLCAILWAAPFVSDSGCEYTSPRNGLLRNCIAEWEPSVVGQGMGCSPWPPSSFLKR